MKPKFDLSDELAVKQCQHFKTTGDTKSICATYDMLRSAVRSYANSIKLARLDCSTNYLE